MPSLARIGNKLFIRNGLPVLAPQGGAVDFACCCAYVEFYTIWSYTISATIGVGSSRQTTVSGGWDSQNQYSIAGPCGTSTGTIGVFSNAVIYERNTTFSGSCVAEGNGSLTIVYNGPANGYATITFNGAVHTLDANTPSISFTLTAGMQFTGEINLHLR